MTDGKRTLRRLGGKKSPRSSPASDRNVHNRLLVVTETRLARDEMGGVWSEYGNDAGSGWARGLPTENVALTYRLRPRQAADVHHLSVTNTYALPNYFGLQGSMLHLPASLRVLACAVRESSTILVRVPTLQGIFATILAKLYGRAVVVEVVGDVRDVAKSGALGFLGRAAAPLATLVCRWVVQQARAARYMTEFALQKDYPPAPGTASVSLSSVRVPSSFWNAWSEEGKSPAPTVVTVGSQATLYKGHQHLIRAIAVLAPRFPELKLLLIGDGRAQSSLKALAKAEGVESRVIFRGHVSNSQDILRDLTDSWVFAMPSLTEGLPRALVEAAATGIPTIGSTAGGIPELVSQENQFEPGDILKLCEILERLFRSSYLRAGASNFSRTAAARYTPELLQQRLDRWVAMVMPGAAQ